MLKNNYAESVFENACVNDPFLKLQLDTITKCTRIVKTTVC